MKIRWKRLGSALLAIGLSLSLLVQPLGGKSAYAEPAKTDTKLQQAVEAMQPGWNLGNTFEASGDETSWGNPTVTKELIQALKAQGYRSIRIPITWNHRLGAAPDYPIQADFMKRIQEVVDWSMDAGLAVIINVHHDSQWMLNMETERETVIAKYTAVWKQIAAHFKNYPSTLLFESVNEPRFSDDWNKDEPIYFEMLDQLNTTFQKIVRASGGKNATRPLILDPLTANHSQARLDELYKTIQKLNDPNLIATIHYYGLYSFSVNVAGSTVFDEAAKNDVTQAFDRAYDTFVAKGIPVIIGEFGLLGFDKSVDTVERGEILKYLEYVTYYAKEKKMPAMLWDNGQHFDRNAFAWKNPEFYAVMKAGLTGRSSNADSDLIFLRQDEPVADTTIHLNLNGNTLKAVKSGDRELSAGTDYVLDGEQLTLKADLLKSLVTDQLGEIAALTCTFSAGADWTFHLLSYKTPTTRSVEGGSRELFVLPVQFNGDKLATMETAYADGGNAGPDDWTPYKEFGKSFSPDYDNNLIQMPKAFFEQVKDGEIRVKLHFWSGAVLDYTMTVSGDAVSGVSPDEPASQPSPSATAVASPTAQASEAPSSEPTKSEEPGSSLYVWIGIGLAVLAAAALTAIAYRKKARK
ncbi:cellulase family glycosylhydrolase [Gorillibacterium sp. sgz500922]|uniref:cellulase family glycosylhydrolase n=1 Tax=Gorillibacterium sp. sgz500922 TaxID=3446694 RepID=UPI003F6635A7